MTKLRPVYRDIKDWAVLAEETVHDFSDFENEIEVVELLIGTLHYEELDFNRNYREFRTPIIRWLTRKQYNYLCEHEGTVIW